MATRTTTSAKPKTQKQIQPQNDVPQNLSEHIFYGLNLNDEQKEFRDAIYDKNIDIVFCNSCAGTGKTLVAVATSVLMKEYGMFDTIYYMSAAGNFEGKQGLLPGTLEQKSFFYQLPLRQALIRLGYNPDMVIQSEDNIEAMKNGSAFINAQTDSYIRGINIGDSESKAILIVEEAQNFKREALRTVLTRLGEGSKAIVIGHVGQIDLRYPQDSGFMPAIQLFKEYDWCKVCELTTCYRSRVATVADKL